MAGYDGRGARFDITVVKGNDLSFTVTAVDGDSVAVDLSAATIVGTIYNGSGTSIDTLTAAVSGAGSNIITLSLTDTEIDALVALDPATWALVVTRGGDDRTWLAGKFNVVAADRARNGTTGTAVTATVDTNVSVTANVLTASASALDLDGLSDVTITTPADGQVLTYDGAGGWANESVTGTGDLLSTANLSDLADAATARTNLGLGSAATTASTDYATAAQGSTADSAASSISNHIADTSDAHDASAISVADVATQYTATDVEAALAEVKVIADAAVTPGEAAAAYQPLDADLTALAAAGNSATLAATTASYTTAEAAKLAAIEAAADVTDATNVDAAGAVMNSDVDAKGDLFVATADNTVTRLAVGTNDQVLTADSAEASGVKWAAAAGGGGGVSSMFLPASSMNATNGSPTFNNLYVALDGASTFESLSGWWPMPIPSDWTTADLFLWWVNLGAGSGDARFDVRAAEFTAGDTLSTSTSVAGIADGSKVITASAQNIVVRSQIGTGGATLTAGEIIRVHVARTPANVADTLENDVGIIGFELVKVS